MNGERIVISGLKHKIGRHGLVFYWNSGEWKKSNKDAKDVQRMIDAAHEKDIKLARLGK